MSGSIKDQRQHVRRKGYYVGLLTKNYVIEGRLMRVHVREDLEPAGPKPDAKVEPANIHTIDFYSTHIGDNIYVWDTDADNEKLKLLARAGGFRFFSR